MINYLAKKMIHNYNELEDPAVRSEERRVGKECRL